MESEEEKEEMELSLHWLRKRRDGIKSTPTQKKKKRWNAQRPKEAASTQKHQMIKAGNWSGEEEDGEKKKEKTARANTSLDDVLHSMT